MQSKKFLVEKGIDVSVIYILFKKINLPLIFSFFSISKQKVKSKCTVTCKWNDPTN